MKERYEAPTLTVYGSVVSLTMGMSGSTPDGMSGKGSGNQSGFGHSHN